MTGKIRFEPPPPSPPQQQKNKAKQETRRYPDCHFVEENRARSLEHISGRNEKECSTAKIVIDFDEVRGFSGLRVDVEQHARYRHSCSRPSRRFDQIRQACADPATWSVCFTLAFLLRLSTNMFMLVNHGSPCFVTGKIGSSGDEKPKHSPIAFSSNQLDSICSPATFGEARFASLFRFGSVIFELDAERDE